MRGLFGSIAAGLSTKATDISNYTWTALLGGVNSTSGVAVNLRSALKVSTVLACARVIAEGIAQQPFKVYRALDERTTKPATDHPVYALLARRPNDWMTAFEMREMMTLHAVLLGDAYAYIGRGQGRIVELIPLVPSFVLPRQSLEYGLTYEVTDMAGGVTTLPRESVLHVRGATWNGYRGLDIIEMARDAIGLSIATEETHASLHANGAQPGGILSVKSALKKDARDRLKEAWQQHQAGIRNKFRTAVLDMDATWTPMAMTGVDAEHIATRAFQIEEICRFMRVFPQMVGHSDKTATFASADAFFQAHVTHSLMPWGVRWEQTVARDLLSDDPKLFARLNFSSLLRGDNATRGEFYLRALGGARAETAWMTRNEVRALEEMDPIEGGDTLPEPVAPQADPQKGSAA